MLSCGTFQKVRGCWIPVLWRCSDPQCTHPSSGWGKPGLPSGTGPHVVLDSAILSRKGTMSLRGSMIFAGQWLSAHRCVVPCLCAWGSPYWCGSVSDQSGLMSCTQIGNRLGSSVKLYFLHETLLGLPCILPPDADCRIVCLNSEWRKRFVTKTLASWS